MLLKYFQFSIAICSSNQHHYIQVPPQNHCIFKNIFSPFKLHLGNELSLSIDEEAEVGFACTLRDLTFRLILIFSRQGPKIHSPATEEVYSVVSSISLEADRPIVSVKYQCCGSA